MQQALDELHSLRTDFNNFKSDVKSDLKEVKDALIGNSLTKGRGLIDEHVEMRNRVTFLERQFQKMESGIAAAKVGTGIIAGICSVAGFFLKLFWDSIVKH